MNSEQFHKEVANLVRKAMIRYSLTSQVLAAYCDTNVATISSIKCGVPVCTDVLIKVLSFLNIRLEVKWL